MNDRERRRRLGDRIVRRPRQRELAPVHVHAHPRRRIVLPASTSALLALTGGFAGLITAGTILLMLPVARAEEGSAPLLTALFTATSAVCITGLSVVATGPYWSWFGEAVIASLMFMGGLGVMTAGLLILTIFGRRISLNQRLVVRETMGGLSLGRVLSMGRYILVFAVITQAVGAIVLFLRFIFIAPVGEAAWFGLFHSISAFNNAGFDVFPTANSLIAFQHDPLFLLLMGVLIMLGGISFPVLAELWRTRRASRWSLDTRLVVLGTVSLWVVGAIAIFLFEFQNPATLGPLSLPHALTNAAFQSITSRTAGFASIDFADTRSGNDYIFMLLMFVGGASGSTAGGIKVNTAMILVAAAVASIRGRERAEFGRREIPYGQVARALAVVLLAFGVLYGMVTALAITEASKIDAGAFGFLDMLFEAVSAFGTVGLSRGITSELTDTGTLVIIVGMYLGRLGPLTIALGLALRERRAVYRFAQERVRIG